eukprot:m.58761 g.58761  ORF g.58761 m.58761 type:complete len:346 (+) comp11197_c0_seq2:106-1143(+)
MIESLPLNPSSIMSHFAAIVVLGVVFALHPQAAHGIRVMFVGNSFTFVNDLPHQLINVAKSFGDDVEVANSTIGGCTLYAQTPDVDQRTAELLQEHWDYIVLQDYSALPTVQAARQKMLHPAVQKFRSHIDPPSTKIVMYLTWGYHDGNTAPCPTSDNQKCFPFGSLANLTNPSCTTSNHYDQIAGTFPCMGYALARGYISTLMDKESDMAAPCGLAWQVVRGVESIPSSCKGIIDSQYTDKFPLDLPFKVNGGADPSLMLYRVFGTSIDKHPNVAGQYLNSLVFYATLTGKSPIGAAPPLNTGSPSAGDRPLTKAEILTLQTAAHGAVEACGKACGLAGGLREH